MRNKKGQAWGMDLMVAIVIFSVGITAFYFYTINSSEETQEIITRLFYDGNIIASDILSEGAPMNWETGNVVKIGILSNNRINETKLENFYLLSTSDYPKTKTIFNTRFNYYFFISEPMIIGGNPIEGLGKKPENSKNLVKITRLTLYKEKPVTFVIYIWE
ncbi:MAG: hypothetical protein ABIH28_03855 [archaeon]